MSDVTQRTQKNRFFVNDVTQDTDAHKKYSLGTSLAGKQLPKLTHKIPNTSTTIRKILVPKKLLSSVRKYVKPKHISLQNQKLTTGKKVPPAHAKQVYLFLCPSVCKG
jgi:hypothetical protein